MYFFSCGLPMALMLGIAYVNNCLLLLLYKHIYRYSHVVAEMLLME